MDATRATTRPGRDTRKRQVSRILLVACVLVVGIGRARSSSEDLDAYLPLAAAPAYHKPVFENEFVLVLDVSIPPGVTVPAHMHPWPAVFITLQPAHLVFRNRAGEVVREVQPVAGAPAGTKVEWREPDSEPASVANVGSVEMRALRVELKFLAR
jgi:hypothetical protein